MPLETVPICYLREEDYAVTGNLITNTLTWIRGLDDKATLSFSGTIRSGAQQRWNQALYSMIHVDLKTRLLLWPQIQKRMDRMEVGISINQSINRYFCN